MPAPDLPVIKELPMPHAVMHLPLDLETIRAQFVPEHHRYGEAHIHFNAVYLGEDSLLFDVYIKEPTIDQRLAFTLLARDTPGDYTLQLTMLGHPRPTAGVHGAAHLLSEWLLSLHPEGRILHAKLQPRLEDDTA